MAEIVISSCSDQSTVDNGFSLLVLCSNFYFNPFRSYFLYCFCTLSDTLRVRRSILLLSIILLIEIVMTNIFGDSCTGHTITFGFIGHVDHRKLFILLRFE